MRKCRKKILLSCLILVLSLFIFASNIKTEAAWSGPSSVNAANYKVKTEEMRAIWIATVYNMDIGAQLGTSEKAINDWKQKYIEILDAAEENGMNTIIFQVRPANDAFYPSKYNPWSEFLAGYGVDPGWDPLEWMIDVTHKRGLDYHAWLNPYRATTNTVTSIVQNGKIVDVDQETLNENKISHFARLSSLAGEIDNPIKKTGNELLHEVVVGSEGKCILNPASANVRKHIENTINELVENYEIDGIHFDDYFYPSTTGYAGSNTAYKGYTYSLEPWIDKADYNNYVSECSQNGVTPLTIYNWRRENVNILIQTISENIRNSNKNKIRKCAFGISPAARYAPTIEACSSEPHRGVEGGMSGSCYNYYSYSDLYADTLKWAKEEWIDYITPQNYTNLNTDYVEICKWWSESLNDCSTKLYMGTALYLVESSWGNGLLEMYYQFLYNNIYVENVAGYFIFRHGSLLEKNGSGAMNSVKKVLWKNNTLTPTYSHYSYNKLISEKPTINSIKINDDSISIKVNQIEYAKGYGIFKVPANETLNKDVHFSDNKNLVSLKINPNENLTFTKEENYQYYLVAFDQDNSIYEEVEQIPLDNKLPIVEASLDKQEYIYGDIAKLKLKISDEDSTSYTLKVDFSSNGNSYIYSFISNEIINEKELEKELTIPEISTTTGKIRVTIIDIVGETSTEIDIKIKSKAPTVTYNKLEDIYVNNNIEWTFDVKDDGFGRVTYKLYYAYNGGEYQEVASGQVRNESYTYTMYISSPQNNCQFKLVLSDNENEVTVYSTVFNILQEKDDQPEPDNEQPTPQPPTKKGCNCNKSSNAFLTLTIIAGFGILMLRKKGK